MLFLQSNKISTVYFFVQAGILSLLCYWTSVDFNSLWFKKVLIISFKLFEYNMKKATECDHLISLISHFILLFRIIESLELTL